MTKVKVGKVSELSPGKMMGLEIEGKMLVLANVDGTYYAMDGLCSHMAAKLWEGKLIGKRVKCPKHGSEFDITTGKALKGPWLPFGRARDMKIYKVSVEGEDIFVEV